jgi:hypothetical protein
MPFDSQPAAKPRPFGPDPAKAFEASMAKFQAELNAKGIKAGAPTIFNEREDDHANTWVPRRHLLEG